MKRSEKEREESNSTQQQQTSKPAAALPPPEKRLKVTQEENSINSSTMMMSTTTSIMSRESQSECQPPQQPAAHLQLQEETKSAFEQDVAEIQAALLGQSQQWTSVADEMVKWQEWLRTRHTHNLPQSILQHGTIRNQMVLNEESESAGAGAGAGSADGIGSMDGHEQHDHRQWLSPPVRPRASRVGNEYQVTL